MIWVILEASTVQKLDLLNQLIIQGNCKETINLTVVKNQGCLKKNLGGGSTLKHVLFKFFS